jgi:hypothetical protein
LRLYQYKHTRHIAQNLRSSFSEIFYKFKKWTRKGEIVHVSAYSELHNLYSSPRIIRMIKSRRMRLAGHVARMVEKSNAYRILVGKTDRKRQLGIPRRR